MIELPEPWPPNPWPTRFRTVRSSEAGHLAPGLRILTLQSPALGGRGELAAFVPPALEAADDVPVVILLHGVFGSFWNWSLTGGAHLTLSRLIAEGRIRPMILVMPSDGMRGEGTGYLPPSTPDGPNFESWVMHDAVDCVREFAAPATAGSPVFLGGNSMGGFGAGRLGCLHSEQVSGIALHSAITNLDQLADFTEGDIAAEAGLTAAKRDLLTYFRSAAGPIPPVYMDCGISDPLIGVNRHLHSTLEGMGVPHRYEEYPGAHDWDSWSRRIEHSLLFFESVLG